MMLDEAPRHDFIKLVSARAVRCSAVFAFVLGGAAFAKDVDKTAVPERELQAKITYCENCHGVSAKGFHGYYPIPRLAGQQTEYLKNQLQAFVERRRTNNIMFNVSHVLSPAMLDALATSFQKSRSQTARKRCSKGADRRRKEDLRRGITQL